MTKKDAKFEWKDECQKSFDSLKSALSTAPVLVLPDYTKDFIIQSDASKKAETRYNATELEFSATAWALDHFKQYVYGRKVVVMTDHKPISQLQKTLSPFSRIAKLLFKIQQHNASIVYKPGKLHINADALSRL